MLIYLFVRSYYVRVVCLGTTLTSFRSSNCKARFSCLTTSHSLTVAVALAKNVYQTFFDCEPLQGRIFATHYQNFLHLLVGDVLKHGHYRKFAPLCPTCLYQQLQIYFQHTNYPKPLLYYLWGLCLAVFFSVFCFTYGKFCVRIFLYDRCASHLFYGSPMCCD